MEGRKKIYRSADQWRELCARQADSGQSVGQFCEAEAINPSVFYRWRCGLQRGSSRLTNKPSGASEPFIDLGALKGAGVEGRCEVRVDFGAGVILSLVRG